MRQRDWNRVPLHEGNIVTAVGGCEAVGGCVTMLGRHVPRLNPSTSPHKPPPSLGAFIFVCATRDKKTDCDCSPFLVVLFVLGIKV